MPTFRENIEKSDFSKIKAWLVNKIHKHVRRYDSLDSMLEDQVGEKLNLIKYSIDYLTKKYSDIYKL